MGRRGKRFGRGRGEEKKEKIGDIKRGQEKGTLSGGCTEMETD
jgi:hypothetical protein